MSLKYKHTAKTLTEWNNLNPVIVENEIVVEKDTNKLKIGNGTDHYLDLLYACSENLNGTNYIMVYAIGTPEENAAELQAAYNAAKKMPRFIGFLNPTTPKYMYAGQTFGIYVEGILKCYKVLVDGTYNPLQMSEDLIVTEAEAKSVRTTVIVAPGKYTFTTPLAVNTEYIDIVSLTGNADVLLNGINVTVNNVYLKGINCGENTFSLLDNFPLIKLEKCIGGNESFGTYFSGIAMNCTGGAESFGFTGDMTGQLQYCKLISGTYPTVSGSGHIVWCINADGSAATNQ